MILCTAEKKVLLHLAMLSLVVFLGGMLFSEGKEGTVDLRERGGWGIGRKGETVVQMYCMKEE